MRGARWSLVVMTVLGPACGSEASAPQATEPTPETLPMPAPATTTPTPRSSTSTLVEGEPLPTVGDSARTPTTAEESAAVTTTTSTATTSTSVTTTTVASTSDPILLRGDGLGEARFGDPMAEVEPWLVREWGAPVWETVARAPLAASQSYEAREHFRTLTFEIGDVSGETGRAATVEVMFSDVNDAHGVARLVGWEAVLNGVEEVTAPEGLTIRMPPAGLDERVPAFEITLGGVNGWTHDFDIVDGPPEAVGIRGHVAGAGRVRVGAGIRRRDHREIPAVPATPHGPIISDLVLRPDGLGPVDFGGSAGEFVDELVDRFGPPAWEMNAWARPGDTLRFRVPLGYFPETELRYLTWYDPGLTISLADGPVYGGSEPGDLRLVNWSTSSNRLRLGTGVGVGSPLSAVVDAHPDLTIGSTAYCSGAYLPAGFSVGTDAVALDGGVEWDWISELQAALNARGAALAVDGEYGPRTASAVGEFQRDAAIGSTDVWDSDGVIGPLTLEALGLAPPATAPVTGLRAGNRGTC